MDWEVITNTTVSQAFGPSVVVFALAAIGLNVQFGYTGLLNFGQAAFAAMGAYGLAMGISTLGWPFWWSILLGLVAALVLALLLGVSTLRLRADYLAIATIAAAEAIRRLVRSVALREYTGGAEGIRAFAEDFREFGVRLGFERAGTVEFGPFFYPMQPHLWMMAVGWTLIALCLLLVWLAMRSPWGRVLKAIREDEDAVRSLGKSAFSYKIQSLTLGGMIGALAGFMEALRIGNVAPDQYHTTFTFYTYAVLILGGAARVFGPVVGAMLFWGLFNFLTAFLRELAELRTVTVGPLEIPIDAVLTTAEVGPFVFVLLGVGIIALLIFRPQGIFGDRREISLNVR
ncbi:MAG: branched-chain amino acid ABC transporter permease [Micromonosporaceae bacterium]|nr:branched-chain amino acid ABC transporter permease [Micromonosporaceae bacterium]